MLIDVSLRNNAINRNIRWQASALQTIISLCFHFLYFVEELWSVALLSSLV